MKNKILILSSLVMLFVVAFSFNLIKADSVTDGTTTPERNNLLTAYGLPNYSQFYYDDLYFLQEINTTMPYIEVDSLGSFNDALVGSTYSKVSKYTIYDANLGEWRQGVADNTLEELVVYWDYFDRYLYFSKPFEIFNNGSFYEITHTYYWDDLYIFDISNQPVFTFVPITSENVIISFNYLTFNYDIGAYERKFNEYEIPISNLENYNIPIDNNNLLAFNLPLQELSGIYSLDGGWLDDKGDTIPSNILDLKIDITFDGVIYFGGIIFDFATSNLNQVGSGIIYYDEVMTKGLFLNHLKPIEVIEFEDVSYVDWIVNSVKSFVDFEIFPNFSVGNILGILISMSLAIWILKVFMGG